jgi:hypothetical protein
MATDENNVWQQGKTYSIVNLLFFNACNSNMRTTGLIFNIFTKIQGLEHCSDHDLYYSANDRYGMVSVDLYSIWTENVRIFLLCYKIHVLVLL